MYNQHVFKSLAESLLIPCIPDIRAVTLAWGSASSWSIATGKSLNLLLIQTQVVQDLHLTGQPSVLPRLLAATRRYRTQGRQDRAVQEGF